MKKGPEGRAKVSLLRIALYIVILIVPWLFAFEILPIPYNNIPVLAEVALYFVWSIVLILAIIPVRKDIRKNAFDSGGGVTGKKTGKIPLTIIWYLMLITLAYLLLCLILIGISFMV
jgi:hypothetical protein